MSEIYEKDAIIHSRYMVQKVLGAGNFSVVYKVLDTISSDVVALKIFKDGTGVLDFARDEFNILKNVNHPHIARVYDIGQITDSPGYRPYFLKLEYVEGEPLSTIIESGRISLGKAKEIVLELLNAVSYMHGQKIMHRDIKPNNILIGQRGAIIIDFNVSKLVVENASSRVGTPHYMPPEVTLQGWNWTGDIFSVGVVLYEMLTGQLPFPGGASVIYKEPRNPLDYNQSLSPSLVSLITKAISYEPQNRFQTAQEMITAIDDANWEPTWRPYSIPTEGMKQIQLSEDEKNRPNYNPYLSRLLTLYSQSLQTNAGTRGLDDFSRATYVETKLDKDLKPAILKGDYPLVIITGNAGDGKTAFIQKLEDYVEKHSLGTMFEKLPSNNGARFIFNGHKFLTNYDGSQDEGEINNDDVLTTFFAPFSGDKPIKASGETRVIAINEGRLIDFLQSKRNLYPFLYQQVSGFFERNQLTEGQLLIVNLNLRAVVADDGQGSSIFEQMIDRLTSPVFWEKCRDCDIANQCYVKFNADSMNDRNYGPQIRQRLKAIFQIAHFRQRLHITIRDLRSALAYILFSTDDCEDIHQLINNQNYQEYLSRFFYNASFDFEQPERSSRDRLVRLISQIDPGQVSNPKLDADIAFSLPNSLSFFQPFDSRSSYDKDLLEKQYVINQDEEQNTSLDQMTENVNNPVISRSRYYHAALRRKIYFERLDENWQKMLPYSQFSVFLNIMSQSEPASLEKVRDDLISAMSLSEGIYDEHLGEEYLCLKTAQEPKATIKSFRRFHKNSFSCEKYSIGELSKYLEYIPSFTILNYISGENVQMEISLDLYEMLHRIRNGYTPSLNELRGSFINLLIFKRQLASTRYDEVLLTEDEQTYYRIYKSQDNKIFLREADKEK